MSEVYCRACENDDDDAHFIHIPKDRLDSPAILTNVTKPKPKFPNKRSNQGQRSKTITDDTELSRSIKQLEISSRSGKSSSRNCENNKDKNDEFELGDDVATENPISNSDKLIETMNTKDLIRVRGKEEFPESNDLSFTQNISNQIDNSHSCSKSFIKQHSQKTVCTDDHPLLIGSVDENCTATVQRHFDCDDFNGNGVTKRQNINVMKQMHRIYSTLPKMKKSTFLQQQRHQQQQQQQYQANTNVTNGPPYSIPTRITPDGTTIYYLCDLNKQILKGAFEYFHLNCH